MNKLYFEEEALFNAIQSKEIADRNRALKFLYMDVVINAKVKQFINEFGSKADPDDVLQEGVILLDEMIQSGRFRKESSVRSFLLGICKNIIRNNARKTDRVILNDDMSQYNHVSSETPDEQLLLLENNSLEQKRDELLQKLLLTLTDNCQKVLKMYYYLSYNMSKIADERGLKNANQAKKAADRCRKQLRVLISERPDLMNFLKQWT